MLDYHAPNLGGRQTGTGHGYHAHDITRRGCAAASAGINQDRSWGRVLKTHHMCLTSAAVTREFAAIAATKNNGVYAHANNSISLKL
jgi:hypothetical protein